MSYLWSFTVTSQDSSVGKSTDLQFNVCRFDSHSQWGVFLVRTFGKPLNLNC